LIKNVFDHKTSSFVIYWRSISSGLINSLWAWY